MSKQNTNEIIKVIISGLDNAGKTSILTALDKKYDFYKDIVSITPTIRIEYKATQFLSNKVVFWDMGGQEQYRQIYMVKRDLFFDNTNLLVYVIDIQDEKRYEQALEYLDMILQYFQSNEIQVPVIVSFHKFDPEIRNDKKILNSIESLKNKILEKYSNFQILFQQTSIFDIISIIQLISYGLSIFDEKFFDLSELLEKYIEIFKCKSLIILDKNGIIISEFYYKVIEPEIYVEFLEAIKENFFILKRMQEESFEPEFNVINVGDNLISCLHQVKINSESFFVSAIIKEDLKEDFLEKYPEFVDDLTKILSQLV